MPKVFSEPPSDGVELAENYIKWPTADQGQLQASQAKISGFKHLVASCQTNVFIGPLELKNMFNFSPSLRAGGAVLSHPKLYF